MLHDPQHITDLREVADLCEQALARERTARQFRALFQALRDPDRLKDRCGTCEYRAICGGSRSRAYAVSGDYLAEEPCCAYRPRAYLATPAQS